MHKYPPLRGNRGKRRTISLKLCSIKLDYASRLMSCQHLRKDMLIFSVSFQKHRLRQGRVKRRQKIQRCSEPCVSRCPPGVDQTATIPRTREFPRDPGEQHTVTRKRVFSLKLPTTCNVRCTQARHEKQRSTKTKKNTVNVKYSRVATFVRFPTKDVLKFRVKIEIC